MIEVGKQDQPIGAVKNMRFRFVKKLVTILNVPVPNELMKTGKKNDIVLHMFNQLKGKRFNTFNSLEKYITSPDYPNGMVDAYILSNLMNINLYILERFPSDKDLIFVDNESSNNILLYLSHIKNIFIFNTIQRGEQSVFELDQLPEWFKNLNNNSDKYNKSNTKLDKK